MSSLFCCFRSQPSPPPLPPPEWAKSFSPEVIDALGGNEKVSKFPVYERLFTLPQDRDHLVAKDHERMNTYLKSDKKNIGVFHISQINTKGTLEKKACIIYIRVFDRLAGKAQFSMFGAYIQERNVSFAFKEKSNERVFSEQTSALRLEPIEALAHGSSLGTYNKHITFTTDLINDSSPILAGHEGRVYLADP
jgi:hypothetical protein